jgi:hypothetical protein
MILHNVPYERNGQFYIYICSPIPPKPIGNDYRKMIGKCPRLFAVVFFGSNHPPFSAIKENPRLSLSSSKIFLYDLSHRVHTEWQRPLSRVHSVMMEKLAQVGEGGGVHALPLLLYISIITYKFVVYAPTERADTLPPISSLPLYVLCGIPFLLSRSPPHPPPIMLI